MREPLEIIMYRNTEIEIHQDDPRDNPNEWDPESSCLVYDHRDFCAYPVLHDITIDSGWIQSIFEDWNNGRKTVEFGGIKYWIFPVYAYIHSGVSLYLKKYDATKYEPTGFDTSFKGFALVSRKYPAQWSKEGAYKIAKQLLDSWNQLLSGEVYGYISKHGSCWGFYGDEGKEAMIAEAKWEIDCAMKQKMEQKIQQLKIFIRNRVPLYARERRLIRVD